MDERSPTRASFSGRSAEAPPGAPTGSGAWSDMRLRRRDENAADLSPFADDWLTATERTLLGDHGASALAFVRWLAERRHRPPVVVTDEDITDERPEPLEEPTTQALEVLAWREGHLAGHLMPWLTQGAAR